MKRDYRREVYGLVFDFFGKDRTKADLWMSSKNPMLGFVAPDEMLRLGRGDRLLKFVETSLAENRRD